MAAPGPRVSQLTGLRAVAVLLVYLFAHPPVAWIECVPLQRRLQNPPFWQLLPHFESGVVLFFMLSGFLMGRLYLRKEFSRANVVAYARARAARVLPLYYVALAVRIFATNPPMASDVHGERRQGAVLAALLLVNANDFGALWTVPVECQFYAVFLAFWCAGSRTRSGRPDIGSGWDRARCAAVHLGTLAALATCVALSMGACVWCVFPQFENALQALYLPYTIHTFLYTSEARRFQREDA